MILELFFVACCCLYLSYQQLRRTRKTSLTAVYDLDDLGIGRPPDERVDGNAVICGGSIAGLLTARVCADHFSKVIIVDPEAWLVTEEGMQDCHHQQGIDYMADRKRSCVPQYTSLHVYQPFSLMALHKLFPNFDCEVEGCGFFHSNDPEICISGIPILFPTGIPPTMCMTRPVYETLLHRLLLSTCTNVEFITGSVTSLQAASTSWESVAYVSVRTASDTKISQVSAALIVDCTGPTRGGLRWFQDTEVENRACAPGSVPFSELKVSYDPKMFSSTCEFKVSPALKSEIGGLVNFQSPGNLYACFPSIGKANKMFNIAHRENDYLQILCAAWDFHEKISTVSDIRAYMSSIITDRPLPSWIFQLLDILESNDVHVSYSHLRVSATVYVRYNRFANLPFNFIAIGDSVLFLNPINGQGCTKACVEAVSLDGLLRKCPGGMSLPPNFGRDFFVCQEKWTGRLWESARIDDYGWQTTSPTKGETLSHGKLSRVFGKWVIELMQNDKASARTMWLADSWLEPPTELESPVILLKVFWRFMKAQIGL